MSVNRLTCRYWKKCSDKRNWHEKGQVNAIGAIVNFCLITVVLFVGSINSQIFLLWITQDLLPKLPANCVVVMDNAYACETFAAAFLASRLAIAQRNHIGLAIRALSD
ncbi:hypothetical protein HUU62_02000 [Rhodoferax sp. 4810]|nr:hypothetical protein [Rhodoferax jenense]